MTEETAAQEQSPEEKTMLTPDERGGIHQRIIRETVSKIATLDPQLYQELQTDPRFELLSSKNQDNPKRALAVRWFVDQLGRVGKSLSEKDVSIFKGVQEELSQEIAPTTRAHIFPRVRRGLAGQS